MKVVNESCSELEARDWGTVHCPPFQKMVGCYVCPFVPVTHATINQRVGSFQFSTLSTINTSHSSRVQEG
jgi:hypothetical protein